MLSHRLGSSKRDDAFRPQRFQCGVHKCQRLDPVVIATENMPGIKAVGDHLIWARMGRAQEHGMKLLRSHDADANLLRVCSPHLLLRPCCRKCILRVGDGSRERRQLLRFRGGFGNREMTGGKPAAGNLAQSWYRRRASVS
jgi:hypothetical protein